jgi:uncharacterized protein (UPF0147 family)
MTKLEEAVRLLEEILNDRGVPRNIKSSIELSIDDLKKSNEPDGVKIATVISVLDDASNDPNISLYARTKVWDVVSKLEELNK